MRILVYGEPRVDNLDAQELASYLARLCPWAEVELRPEFVTYCLERLPAEEREFRLDDLARAWAGARLAPSGARREAPLPVEVAYERRRLTDLSGRALGVLYHGPAVMAALRELIPPAERTWGHLHLVLTNQLLATADPGGRYHCRVAIFGYPCLISTSGAVEAPAKPRAYYLAKQYGTWLGPGAELAAYKVLDPQSYLDYGDPRLTEVLKGFAAQAVAYHLTGQPFCSDPDCRLFNPHWQEEMLRAQLFSPYEFCPAHREWFYRGPQEKGHLG
jgi:hypothetical protein